MTYRVDVQRLTPEGTCIIVTGVYGPNEYCELFANYDAAVAGLASVYGLPSRIGDATSHDATGNLVSIGSMVAWSNGCAVAWSRI